MKRKHWIQRRLSFCSESLDFYQSDCASENTSSVQPFLVFNPSTEVTSVVSYRCSVQRNQTIRIQPRHEICHVIRDNKLFVHVSDRNGCQASSVNGANSNSTISSRCLMSFGCVYCDKKRAEFPPLPFQPLTRAWR